MLSSGIDVASYQPVELIRRLLDEITFGIVKLTEGVGYVNPIHELQLHELAQHGKPIGVYHFFVAGESPRAQWSHFAELLGPYRGRVIVAVDHEADRHGVTPKPADVRRFVRLGQGRGFKVGRYGSDGLTMTYTLGESWRWVARWASQPPHTQWNIWQVAGSGQVDRNMHRLSGDALHAWWHDHCYHAKRSIRPHRLRHPLWTKPD